MKNKITLINWRRCSLLAAILLYISCSTGCRDSSSKNHGTALSQKTAMGQGEAKQTLPDYIVVEKLDLLANTFILRIDAGYLDATLENQVAGTIAHDIITADKYIKELNPANRFMTVQISKSAHINKQVNNYFLSAMKKRNDTIAQIAPDFMRPVLKAAFEESAHVKNIVSILNQHHICTEVTVREDIAFDPKVIGIKFNALASFENCGLKSNCMTLWLKQLSDATK